MAASFLSMMESKLAPGFRFHPRDEELITDYLAKRISGTGATDDFNSLGMMEDVDLNKVEPWDLPDNTCVGGKEWYFFCLRDRKYATGQRTNRATLSGYWKATGKDRPVMDGRKGGRLVGMRKTLVFYRGRAPKGKKTDWVMHEFRMELNESIHIHNHHHHHHQQQQHESTLHSSCINNSLNNNDWVLCRVFCKSTRGGRISVDTTASSKDDASSSSSLPSLIDTYINFEQPCLTNANMQYGFNQERVPCFSNILNGTGLPLPTTNAINLKYC